MAVLSLGNSRSVVTLLPLLHAQSGDSRWARDSHCAFAWNFSRTCTRFELIRFAKLDLTSPLTIDRWELSSQSQTSNQCNKPCPCNQPFPSQTHRQTSMIECVTPTMRVHERVGSGQAEAPLPIDQRCYCFSRRFADAHVTTTRVCGRGCSR